MQQADYRSILDEQKLDAMKNKQNPI